jgi:hypothetical protein
MAEEESRLKKSVHRLHTPLQQNTLFVLLDPRMAPPGLALPRGWHNGRYVLLIQAFVGEFVQGMDREKPGRRVIFFFSLFSSLSSSS